MFSVSDVLLSAGVQHSVHYANPGCDVYLTKGNQLIGTFKGLADFRAFDSNYIGWHRHHIVEDQDWGRLGLNISVPPYEDQPCVLLPERAHVGRINSILQRYNPHGMIVTGQHLRQAYRDAYQLMDDYCGGGAVQVRKELIAIVDAEFQRLGVR